MFTEYTRRYQEIMLQIPLAAFQEDFRFESLVMEEREHLLRRMRAYFDLCSEEQHLNKKGRLEAEVWSYWRDGMIDLLRHPAFKEAWEIISKDKYYHEAFEIFVETIKSS